MLSSRAQALCASNEYMITAMQSNRAIYSNQWHSETNPQGHINFSTAENNLCEDILNEKFESVDNFWEPNKDQIFHGPVPGGYESTKEKMVEFVNRLYEVSIKAENTVLAPGVTAAFDMLSFCVAEPSDIVLAAAPYYGRIFSNFDERGRVHVVPVPCRDLSNPKLEVEAFEAIFNELKAQGKNVRAVVVINPENPLGVVFGAEELVALANWIYQFFTAPKFERLIEMPPRDLIIKNMVFIVDEIYASAVYKDKEKFTSVLSLEVTHPENIVWLWGISKIMCLPGLRFAAIHSENKDLMECLKKLENLQPCSPLVQNIAVKLFSDYDWFSYKFLPENLKRLERHYDIVSNTLTELSIPFTPATAGFCVFCNFAELLENKSFEEETKLFKVFCSAGVYMTSGQFQACDQPGWMRLVFAGRQDALEEGMRRLKTIVVELRNKIKKH